MGNVLQEANWVRLQYGFYIFQGNDKAARYSLMIQNMYVLFRIITYEKLTRYKMLALRQLKRLRLHVYG